MHLASKFIRASLAILAATCFYARGDVHHLVIRDNIGKEWESEPIHWPAVFTEGEWDGKRMLVSSGGKPFPAQANVKSLYAGGSVREAEILFIIDRLDRGATAHVTLEPAKDGPAATDLAVHRTPGSLVLGNSFTAIRLADHAAGAAAQDFSPVQSVRLPDGSWTGKSFYQTRTTRPVSSRTELVEAGPVRVKARVTTTFDNGRAHVLTVSLLSRSRSIDIEEEFSLGPDDKYQFKQFKNDRDELAWEWWGWYGDREGIEEDHPNNWFLVLNSSSFQAAHAAYLGSPSTDAGKGSTQSRGQHSYPLDYAQPRRLEKYLAGHGQWRPDAVGWYMASSSSEPGAPAIGLFTHSVGDWRNPNVLPLSPGITLRTGANDMRILSFAEGKQLVLQCPIGLGQRRWAIHVSTLGEALSKTENSPTALSAEVLKRNLGLGVTRHWVTDWEMNNEYPRLFVKPKDKEAYYARLRGQPISELGGFLRVQDRASFDRAWRDVNQQADRMLDGYLTLGLDSTHNYPGWMLGYWHGIIVAAGVDNLVGTPYCTEEMARSLKKKLAILTYCLVSPHAWSTKQVNYGWGSMNMPVARWGGLVVMASALSDHPRAAHWLKDANRYFNMLLETEYNHDGTHISCPHYIGASVTSLYAWIIMANNGLGPDVSRSPVLKKFARYYMQLMMPVDPRWGIRTLLPEGDSRPGSSSFPGILATLFKDSDPQLAGQLMQMWIDGGRVMSGGMGIPDAIIIDPSVKPLKPDLFSEVYPGFGAILRHREIGSKEEAYLSFLAGDFMIDHVNTDQMAFAWHEKGVPLTIYKGDMYVPGAVTALSHNTLCWDVRPAGAACPGKGRPGCWYHDYNMPWVDHQTEPRKHLEIGWHSEHQKITDQRGRMTFASEQPEAALLEGRVEVKTLFEIPTRPDYSQALQQHTVPVGVLLAEPFTWKRRLLYVKSGEAGGMNYLVVRDDLSASAGRAPSFNYWSLSKDVRFEGRWAFFDGQLGVDTDLYVARPNQFTFFKDSFTHTQCEPVVASRGFKQEKQVLARVESAEGNGFLVVVFPRKAGEEKPIMRAWLGGKGLQIKWKDETHFVLLEAEPVAIDDERVSGRASSLVLKSRNGAPISLTLPEGGSVVCNSLSIEDKEPVSLNFSSANGVIGKGRVLYRAPDIAQ